MLEFCIVEVSSVQCCTINSSMSSDSGIMVVSVCPSMSMALHHQNIRVCREPLPFEIHQKTSFLAAIVHTGFVVFQIDTVLNLSLCAIVACIKNAVK